MAITQISRIQHRRGLRESLPQLAAGELGWAVDTQELFIGNGTITEGAPETGNTKIITEDDNILGVANTYTFRGNTNSPVVTGVDNNNPIVRTLQQKLDDIANVKDFGAVGDGATDDTAAINRAIANLHTVETSGKERRSLYFPGGTYKVSDPILIYPYTTLMGDGMKSTIIKQTDSSEDCVIRTCDSRGNISANIGSDGATTPQAISISNLSLETDSLNNIAILDSAQDMHFTNVHFTGIYTNQLGPDSSQLKSCVDIRGTTSNPSKRIYFLGCSFESSPIGINSDYDIEDIMINGSEFRVLYRGVNLAENTDGVTANKLTGPTGVSVQNSRFDQIDEIGVYIHKSGGHPHGNIVAGNSFRDVGANSDDSADVPTIRFDHGNNFAYGNFFHRTDILSNFEGNMYHEGPVEMTITLNDNTSGFQNVINPFTSNALQYDTQRETHIVFDYCMGRGTTKKRRGKLTVESVPGSVVYSDDYTENADCGITLQVTAQGVLQYSATNTGETTAFKYRILHFV